MTDSLDEDLRVISDEAMKLMNKYDWPGNVRQLEKCLLLVNTYVSITKCKGSRFAN